MIEHKNFWYDEGRNELNINNECKSIQVNIGSNQTIQISKKFSPLIFCDIRITPVLETNTWKIERECITQDKDGNDIYTWETISEFDAQDSIDFDNND
jgi:hypothetical protein